MVADRILMFRDYKDDPVPRIHMAHLGYIPWLRTCYLTFIGAEAPAIPDTFTMTVDAYVDSGRWLWDCVACNTAIEVDLDQPSICVVCGSGNWLQVELPDNRAEIESELLKQPGFRTSAPIRSWRPGITLEDLQERTAKADLQVAAGVAFVRKLSIGTPRTYSVGEILTANTMNTYVRDIQRDLAGINGPIEYESAIVLDSFTTTERDALTETNGMSLYNRTTDSVEFYEDGAWRSGTDISGLTISGAAPGDIFYVNPTGDIARLPIGPFSYALRSRTTAPHLVWSALTGFTLGAGVTRGEVLFVNSAGAIGRLASGAAGTVVTSQGTGADPTYSDVVFASANLSLIIALG